MQHESMDGDPQDRATAQPSDSPPQRSAVGPPMAPPSLAPIEPVGPSGKPGREDLLMYRTLPATQGDLYRLSRLLWAFVLLGTVMISPFLVKRIQYAITSAQEKAKYDVAKQHLVDFQLDQLSAAYRMLPDLVGPSVVSVGTESQSGRGQGSGVIIDEDGYIITNYHVVEGVVTADIQLSDGRTGTASVVGSDPLIDIAVLKTELDDLIPAQWADEDSINVGDLVWAVGSPFGLSKSITSGIISAKERKFVSDSNFVQEYLQTDAAVNPGNSGGPLVNIQGKIVGINTAIVGPTYQGISFSIPADRARDSYEQLRETGTVMRGFLGVSLEALTEAAADQLGLSVNAGVLIRAVVTSTPASAARLRSGDVLLTWNGTKYSDPAMLSQVIAATDVGEEVEITVARRNRRGQIRELDLTVKVGAFPRLPETSAR